MQIGIFGDSYSFHELKYSTQSWVEYLSNDFNVYSHSTPGSSTYLIYQNFLKFQHLYDKVIVLVTFPARIHTSIAPVSSADAVDHYIKVYGNLLSYDEKKILSNVKPFISTLLLDKELTNQFIVLHTSLIETMKSMRPDILFIPAFSFENTEFCGSSLYDVTLMEENFWSNDWNVAVKNNAKFFDQRQCHLSEPNNFILYNEIKQIITTVDSHITLDLNVKKFVKPDSIKKYIP